MEAVDNCPDCISGYSDERLDQELTNTQVALNALTEHLKTLQDERWHRWYDTNIKRGN